MHAWSTTFGETQMDTVPIQGTMNVRPLAVLFFNVLNNVELRRSPAAATHNRHKDRHFTRRTLHRILSFVLRRRPSASGPAAVCYCWRSGLIMCVNLRAHKPNVEHRRRPEKKETILGRIGSTHERNTSRPDVPNRNVAAYKICIHALRPITCVPWFLRSFFLCCFFFGSYIFIRIFSSLFVLGFDGPEPVFHTFIHLFIHKRMSKMSKTCSHSENWHCCRIYKQMAGKIFGDVRRIFSSMSQSHIECVMRWASLYLSLCQSLLIHPVMAIMNTPSEEGYVLYFIIVIIVLYQRWQRIPANIRHCRRDINV